MGNIVTRCTTVNVSVNHFLNALECGKSIKGGV